MDAAAAYGAPVIAGVLGKSITLVVSFHLDGHDVRADHVGVPAAEVSAVVAAPVAVRGRDGDGRTAWNAARRGVGMARGTTIFPIFSAFLVEFGKFLRQTATLR